MQSMEDFWITLTINAGIGAILTSIKNPNSQRAQMLKSSLLHLADAIHAAFPEQPELPLDTPKE